jgi:hypothetical protein
MLGSAVPVDDESYDAAHPVSVQGGNPHFPRSAGPLSARDSGGRLVCLAHLGASEIGEMVARRKPCECLFRQARMDYPMLVPRGAPRRGG